MNRQRLFETLLKLVAVPSITGSTGEAAMAKVLFELLMEIDYFRAHPSLVSLIPVTNDPCNRSAVCALLKGAGDTPKTVILLSHYDVVGIEDYGLLADCAWQPRELERRLRSVSLTDEAARDLKSGDYLFGRGVMDMKFGIALHLELLRQAAESGRVGGNILLLSVPDEEANSLGMLSAVPELLQLQSQGLQFTGAVNSEPFFPAWPGDPTRYIYTGTVGKLLPLVFCRGEQTHAGEPFAGLNPDLMLSAVVRQLECNPTLAETRLGLTSPPPVCLKMRDLKNDYSVQTPAAAYAYFNLITLGREPADWLTILKELVQAAMQEVVGSARHTAADWLAISGIRASLPDWNPPVLTSSELLALCARSVALNPAELTARLISGLTAIDLREATAEFLQKLLSYCPLRGPLAVIALAPPYYPHSSLDDSPVDRKMRETAALVVARAGQKHGVELVHAPFFPALSDMSYLRLSPGVDPAAVAINTPLWGARYRVPLEEIRLLNIPFINIGPQGKDAHRFTERLQLPYSLSVVPDLLRHAVELLLQ